MSKDIGMGVRKGTVVSLKFVPTLFGCFLGIPSLAICLFFLLTLFKSSVFYLLPKLRSSDREWLSFTRVPIIGML